MDREYGEFVFEASSGRGDYLVYYMPYYNLNDQYYQDIAYLPPNPEHCVRSGENFQVIIGYKII
jgi:hypothetical protein